MSDDRLDAIRYRRLANLIDCGEWFVGFVKTVDKYGNVEETYAGNKKSLDKYLDSKEAIADCLSWILASSFIDLESGPSETVSLDFKGEGKVFHNFCKADFYKLKASGMLWEFYPNAPEEFPN